MMRRALLTLALAGAAAPALAQTTPATPPPAAPATAPDPARQAAAERLLRQMGMEATLDHTFAELTPFFAKAVIGELAGNPQSKAMIDAIDSASPDNHDLMIAILSQEFTLAIKRQYPAFIKRAAIEYAAAFTTEELQAIANFYATGPGAKALKLLPELQTKIGAQGRELGRIAGAEAGKRAFARIRQEMLPETRSKSS